MNNNMDDSRKEYEKRREKPKYKSCEATALLLNNLLGKLPQLLGQLRVLRELAGFGLFCQGHEELATEILLLDLLGCRAVQWCDGALVRGGEEHSEDANERFRPRIRLSGAAVQLGVDVARMYGGRPDAMFPETTLELLSEQNVSELALSVPLPR